MAVLLFGATGMVGQAISRELARRGRAVTGVARHGSDVCLDLSQAATVSSLIEALRPELVVNAAAVADVDRCERDPATAYLVNARAASLLAEACRAASVPFVQISTDHFFAGDGARPHAEDEPATLVNEYARTKYAGEALVASRAGALVVRTNVAGLRGWSDRPTFAEWALDALTRRKPLRLFEDFHTSTIDSASFARALLDLAATGTSGVVNLASRTVASKRRFVHVLARHLAVNLDWDRPASVRECATPRAESLGLDVSKAERSLGYALPDLEQVCANLVMQWKEERCAMLQAS